MVTRPNIAHTPALERRKCQMKAANREADGFDPARRVAVPVSFWFTLLFGLCTSSELSGMRAAIQEPPLPARNRSERVKNCSSRGNEALAPLLVRTLLAERFEPRYLGCY